MKPQPTVHQKCKPAEYVYSLGHTLRTFADAQDRIDSLIADGEVSRSENPRAVRYTRNDGSHRYAIILTDTTLAAYM